MFGRYLRLCTSSKRNKRVHKLWAGQWVILILTFLLCTSSSKARLQHTSNSYSLSPGSFFTLTFKLLPTFLLCLLSVMLLPLFSITHIICKGTHTSLICTSQKVNQSSTLQFYFPFPMNISRCWMSNPNFNVGSGGWYINNGMPFSEALLPLNCPSILIIKDALAIREVKIHLRVILEFRQERDHNTEERGSSGPLRHSG